MNINPTSIKEVRLKDSADKKSFKNRPQLKRNIQHTDIGNCKINNRIGRSDGQEIGQHVIGRIETELYLVF